jgi:TonB family protein
VRGDVYSLDEVARAAGVPPANVDGVLAGHGLTTAGDYLSESEAVRLTRLLAGKARISRRDRTPLTLVRGHRRRQGLPLVASGALHVGLVLLFALAATLGLLSANDTEQVIENPSAVRLVYLMSPGPGGGGGGGGLKVLVPPPPARRKAPEPRKVSSPVPPIRRPPPPRPRPTPPRPPVRMQPVPVVPAKADPLPNPPPAIFAPVRQVAADSINQTGRLDLPPAPARPSPGPGQGGGIGSGRGTGIGEGTGSGIGPGSGGGTGGGPFQPGSGISPPTLIREIRPAYTPEARRRAIEGDVALQIVVRRDGSVGDVRVVRSLGAGLDQKAIEAVRQWRFGPARRQGQPVDVLVDVSVAFTLR